MRLGQKRRICFSFIVSTVLILAKAVSEIDAVLYKSDPQYCLSSRISTVLPPWSMRKCLGSMCDAPK